MAPLVHRLPVRVRQHLRSWLALGRFVLFFRRTAHAWRAGAAPPDDALLLAARTAWGNAGFAARTPFLAAAIAEVAQTDGAVLECGSGLSTILLAAMARSRGLRYVALEHDPAWHARVRWALRLCGLPGSAVRLTPLRTFEGFAWYDLRRVPLPRWVSVVLCDGPPGTITGGRYGLLPRLRGRLRHRSRIVLDDADRPAEQAIVARWEAEFGVRTIGAARDGDSALLLEAP